MTDASERSLGDDATFAGHAKRQRADVSIGDERTLGDGLSGQETIIDDSEVIDLEARHRVDGELGQGGMGAVLLATDTRLDRKVAIKRILGEKAGDRMAVNRFLTEAKAIAALNHPNIVQIYDYGRAKDGPFLIMEYVDGGSLLDRCRDGAMPLESAIDLVCQLCDGLAKAHDLGIIHRDIKPANILLTKDGIAKLTDFGLAKAEASDQQMTMTGAVMGTPDFMPPEQRRDAALVDHRSDLWSLAATLYQAVSGRSPKVIRLHELPVELQPIVGKALEDEKESRYQSAREFRDALRTAREGSRKSTAPAKFDGVLQEGQCKACGTVTSDLTKRFCRNPQCGASLRVACLKCDAQMPVWDGVCGECGGNQPALLDAKRKTLEAKRAKAEALLADLAFDEAIGLANEAKSESRMELADLAEWALAFVAAATVERDRQRSAATGRLQDARKHVAACDYPAAIQSLEMIPHRLRDAEATSLLSDCHCRREESEELLAEITGRIGRKEIEGLLPLVERAVGLRGDRADLAKIRQQLTERRDVRLARGRAAMASGDVNAAAAALAGAVVEDLGPEGGRLLKQVERRRKQEQARDESLKQAAALVDQHDYEGAVATLATVAPEAMTSAVTELRERAESLASTADALAASIWKAEKVGTLDGSLAEINRYLELKPGDARVATLRQAVVARQQMIEERDAAVATARDAIDRQDFDAAARALDGVNPTVMTHNERLLQSEVRRALDRIVEIASRLWGLEDGPDRQAKGGAKRSGRDVEADVAVRQALLKELLQLHPDDSRAHTELAEYAARQRAEENAVVRRQAATRFEQLFGQHLYKKAADSLARLEPDVMTADLTALLEKARNTCAEVDRLRLEIQSAVEAEDDQRVASVLDKYLQLVPNDDEAGRLKHRLCDLLEYRNQIRFIVDHHDFTVDRFDWRRAFVLIENEPQGGLLWSIPERESLRDAASQAQADERIAVQLRLQQLDDTRRQRSLAVGWAAAFGSLWCVICGLVGNRIGGGVVVQVGVMASVLSMLSFALAWCAYCDYSDWSWRGVLLSWLRGLIGVLEALMLLPLILTAIAMVIDLCFSQSFGSSHVLAGVLGAVPTIAIALWRMPTLPCWIFVNMRKRRSQLLQELERLGLHAPSHPARAMEAKASNKP